MKFYSPYQFAIFRIILGLYLVIHFATLIPYAPELFSSAGMIPDRQALFWMNTPLQVQIFVSVLLLLALVFTTGRLRRITALLLWFGWACLLNRNVFISNPGLPYVGWILLACVIVPSGEPLVLGKAHDPDKPWEFPWLIFLGAWIFMAAGYSISGLHKLQSPSWVDGSALTHVLNSPLARDNFLRNFLLGLPPIFFQLKTWGCLAIELAFLPLCLFSFTRKWIWLIAVGMQLGILCVVNFADLTFGVLMIHFFTFDARWVKSLAPKEKPIVFFDGYCGLCNWFVNFALTEDRNRTLLFSPLQGQAAKSRVGAIELEKLESIVLYDNGKSYRQSDAILRVLRHMGGVWGLFCVLKIIPRKIRDGIYHVIATHRYQWFGKKDNCRLPTQSERKFFLD